jgi:hypothetical protein
MSELVNLLLGGRTAEEVVAEVGQRIAHDAEHGTVYGRDVVHEAHFTHGAMHPVAVAYTTPPAPKPSIEERIRAMLAEMDSNEELKAALDRSHAEIRAAIPNPKFVDPGTPPEMIELFKKDPFIPSRVY